MSHYLIDTGERLPAGVGIPTGKTQEVLVIDTGASGLCIALPRAESSGEVLVYPGGAGEIGLAVGFASESLDEIVDEILGRNEIRIVDRDAGGEAGSEAYLNSAWNVAGSYGMPEIRVLWYKEEMLFDFNIINWPPGVPHDAEHLLEEYIQRFTDPKPIITAVFEYRRDVRGPVTAVIEWFGDARYVPGADCYWNHYPEFSTNIWYTLPEYDTPDQICKIMFGGEFHRHFAVQFWPSDYDEVGDIIGEPGRTDRWLTVSMASYHGPPATPQAGCEELFPGHHSSRFPSFKVWYD